MEDKITPNSIALFDFDGTLTTKDSFIVFIKFYRGYQSLLLGLILNLPILLLYKLKVIPNWKAKEKLMQYFFNGVTLNEFDSKANDFSLREIPKMLRPEIVEHLELHKKAGSRILLVSASFENWLKPWAQKHGMSVIATQLVLNSQRLTGKINGKNCYGPEKEVRIRQEIDLTKFDKIYAYGDSRGDREMLKLADFSYYRGKLK